MSHNLTQTLIHSHLAEGKLSVGEEMAIRIDQALLQDVLGTLVMLELEAMGVDRVKTDVAAQYIDHNLLETNHLNGDEHLICARHADDSASGIAAQVTASATQCTCNASANRGKPSSAAIVIPRLQAESVIGSRR
jgi:homoaconitase/3-isopropylmalate dehydratase large subunit